VEKDGSGTHEEPSSTGEDCSATYRGAWNTILSEVEGYGEGIKERIIPYLTIPYHTQPNHTRPNPTGSYQTEPNPTADSFLSQYYLFLLLNKCSSSTHKSHCNPSDNCNLRHIQQSICYLVHLSCT